MDLNTILSVGGGLLMAISGWLIKEAYGTIKESKDRLEKVLTEEQTRVLVMDMLKPIEVKQEALSEEIDKIDKKLDQILWVLLRTPSRLLIPENEEK